MGVEAPEGIVELSGALFSQRGRQAASSRGSGLGSKTSRDEKDKE